MLSDVVYRLRALFQRESMEGELDEELRAHLEQQAEKYVKSGMPREAAARRARLEFGGVDQAKEECRDARGVSFIEAMIQDLRYGLRQLRRSPAFTAVAVITLALGIGATTAIFSVVDAVLLHQAPYQNAAQLVESGATSPQGRGEPVSVGDFSDWQEQSRTFQALAAYKQWEFHTLTGAGEPDEVWASPVSANLFRLLGINATIGRTFATNESRTVVLSHEYWRSLASDPKIIGAILALDGTPYTVVGIAPADLEFPAPNTQMWVPLTFNADDRNDHEHRSLSVIGRLKAGANLKQAQAEMDLLARRVAMQHKRWVERYSPAFQRPRSRQCPASGHLRAPGRVGLCVDDRLRQRGQHASGSRRHPARRDGHPRRFRGWPVEADPATRCRKCALGRRLQRRGIGVGMVGSRDDRKLGAEVQPD